MSTPEQLIKQYVGDTISFTVATYQHMRRNSEVNFVSSPFSMETFLILLRLGAKGATADEIITKLRQSSNQSKIESAVKSLLSALTQGGFYTYNLANMIFVKKDCVIKDAFKKLSEEVFCSYVDNMDFEDRPATVKRINSWVKNQTFGGSGNLIAPNQFPRSSELVLVNSLYVNTMWATKFTKKFGGRRKFFTAEDEFVEAEYMTSRGLYKVYKFENLARMIEIKFLSDEGRMVIVLPNTREGLPQVQNKLVAILNTPMNKLDEEKIQIELPEFIISTVIDFKNILQECGVKQIFRRGEADISGVAGKRGDLHVNAIIQKVVLKIDERGIETTKRNAYEWKKKNNAVPKNKVNEEEKNEEKEKEDFTEFIVDHPFMFYVKVEQVVLFVGRVVDPSLKDDINNEGSSSKDGSSSEEGNSISSGK